MAVELVGWLKVDGSNHASIIHCGQPRWHCRALRFEAGRRLVNDTCCSFTHRIRCEACQPIKIGDAIANKWWMLTSPPGKGDLSDVHTWNPRRRVVGLQYDIDLTWHHRARRMTRSRWRSQIYSDDCIFKVHRQDRPAMIWVIICYMNLELKIVF